MKLMFRSKPKISYSILPKRTISEFINSNLGINVSSTQTLLDHSLSKVSKPLSNEQTELLNLLKSGHNVYFTGKAGSGKTEVLRIFIEHLRENRIKIGVTAPTGVAASLVEGQTLHSFSSLPIDLRQFDIEAFCKYVKSKKTILKRYLETECIIIDEISMVSSDFFDAFNDACKKLRANQAPFGGIQIVMTGDFFQLPPVPNSSMQQTCVTSSSQNCEEKRKIIEYPHYSAFLNHIYKETYDEIKHRGVTGKIKEDVKTKYLFHSKSWLDLFMNQMKIRELTETFRQIDPLFVSLLDDLRFGVHSKEMWSFLNQYKKKHHQWDNSVFEPTYLSPYRLATARYNTKKLIEIPGNVYSYESIDSVKLNEPVNSWVDVSSPFHLQHIFSSFSAHECLNLKVGAQVILVRNLDVKNNLANGSRGVVIAFEKLYDNLTNRTQMLPVVQFSSGNSYIVGYHDFQTRLDVDGITVQRKQIPLQLGWGMTIHRAQGVTLDKVIIDLPVSFAPGHAYVAFSRVKTLQGLSIERFGPKSLCASEKVKQFYTFFLTGRHQGNP